MSGPKPKKRKIQSGEGYAQDAIPQSTSSASGTSTVAQPALLVSTVETAQDAIPQSTSSASETGTVPLPAPLVSAIETAQDDDDVIWVATRPVVKVEPPSSPLGFLPPRSSPPFTSFSSTSPSIKEESPHKIDL